MRRISQRRYYIKDYFYNYNEKAGKPQTFKLQPPPASKNHGESNSYGEIKLLIVVVFPVPGGPYSKMCGK